MEEPGEKCTVVFALIVTEPASEAWEGCYNPTPSLLLAAYVTIYSKTTVHCIVYCMLFYYICLLTPIVCLWKINIIIIIIIIY
jgi:hypothetical protein